MRITDDRYSGDMHKFDLAVRMIGHEARTGTIRFCTGFTEDRIRKLYGTYFATRGAHAVRRRRGKSPRQIARFVNSARRQVDATFLACLLHCCDVFRLTGERRPVAVRAEDRVALGTRICQAFETYQRLVPDPQFSFEWAWNLYHALLETHELYLAWCDSCYGPYVQDSYALDYRRCPLCELKDQATRP
jgi:hypothetical protein